MTAIPVKEKTRFRRIPQTGHNVPYFTACSSSVMNENEKQHQLMMSVT